MDRRYKIVIITFEDIEKITSKPVNIYFIGEVCSIPFSMERFLKWYNLPEDVRIDDIRVDKFRGIMEVLIWSSEFDEVPLGVLPLEINFECRYFSIRHFNEKGEFGHCMALGSYVGCLGKIKSCESNVERILCRNPF